MVILNFGYNRQFNLNFNISVVDGTFDVSRTISLKEVYTCIKWIPNWNLMHWDVFEDPGQILQRLADEIEYAFDVMEGREETTATKKKEVEDVRDIINQLAAGINKIQSKGKQCIIIIDGVDKVPKASRTEEVWHTMG